MLDRSGVHIVQSRCYVSHQSHEEEWNLKDIVLDEIQAIDQFIIPCRMLEIKKQGEKPYQNLDSDNLREVSECVKGERELLGLVRE
jgi:hypothetical protein